MSYWVDFPKRQSLSETGSPAYTRTCLAQSSDLESIANTDCPGSLIPKMSQASPSDIGRKEPTPFHRPRSPGQICTPPSTNNTEPGCHHNSFWGSRCDSNHAPTISLRPCISFLAISAIPLTHDTYHHTAYLITSKCHQVHFPTISAIFSPSSLHFG